MERLWTEGECWLCDGSPVPVLWLGPVKTAGGTAPFMACEACILRVEQRVQDYHLRPQHVSPQ